jgi:V/A-type H+-transporting ATPase subunit E
MEQEVSVQALLDRIKREGIEKAEKSAEEIVEGARSKAGAIIEDARKRADILVREAEDKARRTRESFRNSMRQAGRTLVLSVREEIIAMCRRLLERKVNYALTPEFIQQLILKMAEALRGMQGTSGVEVLLSEEDRAVLQESLLGSLQEEMKNGIELKVTDRIRSGFFIGEKGGDMHYDLTPEGVAAFLSQYLSDRIALFLRESSE